MKDLKGPDKAVKFALFLLAENERQESNIKEYSWHSFFNFFASAGLWTFKLIPCFYLFVSGFVLEVVLHIYFFNLT